MNDSQDLDLTPCRALLRELCASFRGLKNTADGAIAQTPLSLIRRRLDPESNSIAHVMQHLAGNMRSRWTEFRTADGEKPDRHRDAEFEDPPVPKDPSADLLALRADWEDGWRILFAALDSLAPEELDRSITIRSEPHTVRQAVLRHLTHTAYHVGQIVQLAKHAAGATWRPLTVPRGRSEEFNAQMRARFAPRPDAVDPPT